MAESGKILEGFLCPICKADLGSERQLRLHFQDEEHKEHQDVFKSLKDVFEKAKKKILKIDDEGFNPDFTSVPGPSEVQPNTYVRFEPQEMGATRSYTDFFRDWRSKRLERYTAETNRLLIRLGKLLSDLPLDPVKRKSHEQSVVPWIDDRDVKLCPSCAKSFHVARRKHHCRLCGAIMCYDCTHFLELSEARKMVNVGFSAEDGASGSSASASKSFAQIRSLGRSSSNSSLNSVLSLVESKTGDQHLRLCVHCKLVLEMREKVKESRNLKPIISQFYDRLQMYMTEADELNVLYNKMSQSLNCGETTYTLDQVQDIRARLIKLAESIDILSKKIAILGTKDVENPPQGKVLQLQQNIKTATGLYLKEKLISMPTLPSETQLKAIQDSRR